MRNHVTDRMSKSEYVAKLAALIMSFLAMVSLPILSACGTMEEEPEVEDANFEVGVLQTVWNLHKVKDRLLPAYLLAEATVEAPLVDAVVDQLEVPTSRSAIPRAVSSATSAIPSVCGPDDDDCLAELGNQALARVDTTLDLLRSGALPAADDPAIAANSPILSRLRGQSFAGTSQAFATGGHDAVPLPPQAPGSEPTPAICDPFICLGILTFIVLVVLLAQWASNLGDVTMDTYAVAGDHTCSDMERDRYCDNPAEVPECCDSPDKAWQADPWKSCSWAETATDFSCPSYTDECGWAPYLGTDDATGAVQCGDL